MFSNAYFQILAVSSAPLRFVKDAYHPLTVTAEAASNGSAPESEGITTFLYPRLLVFDRSLVLCQFTSHVPAFG
jgi:hypothetical protein